MGNSASSMEIVVDDVIEKLDILRSNALKNLHEILRIRGKPHITVNDDELDAFKLQVENRMLLVTFVGEGSSGKSTLINVILRDEFLPYGCPRTTNMRVYIKHNPNIHIGRCQEHHCKKCPKVWESIVQEPDQKPLCTGVDHIKKKIALSNRQAREGKKDVVLVIEANVEMFKDLTLGSNAQGPSVYIVDCPGMEYLREDTGVFLTTTSQMIYVFNYSRFLQDIQKAQSELLQKASSAKLLVAITHFDQYYEPRTGTLNENPDGNTVKQHVSQAIKGVKEDDVFPVCGKWVLNAHLLKKLPTDSNIQLVVRHAYENYMQKTTDSSSVSEQSIMIDTVLKMGGLKKLEERICKSVCDTDWKKVIFSQAEKLLQKPLQAAKDLLKEMRKDCEALRVKVTKGQKKDRKITEALKHIENRCDKMSVIRETKDKFKIEDFLSKAQPQLVSTVNTFTTHCNREAQKSVYTVGRFDREFKKFEEKTFPNKIKETYQNQSIEFFHSQKDVLRTKLKKIELLLEEDINEEHDSNPELNSECPGEPKFVFTDPLQFLREKTRTERFHHWGKSVVGFGVAGVVGAVSTTIVAAPVGVLGAGVGLYQFYKGWTLDEKDKIISQTDLVEMHKRSVEDIESAHNADLLTEYFENGMAQHCQTSCEVIAGYAQDLWTIYESNLTERHEEFTRKLEKNVADLKRITKQITKLEAAHQELKKADSFIRENAAIPIIVDTF